MKSRSRPGPQSSSTLRKRFTLLLTSACLFQTTGCPQIFGDAIQSAFRQFIEVGVPSALLSALDIEGLLTGP